MISSAESSLPLRTERRFEVLVAGKEMSISYLISLKLSVLTDKLHTWNNYVSPLLCLSCPDVSTDFSPAILPEQAHVSDCY